MAPPLFVIGTSRSGTSWAFELFAGHPDMSMGYESKIPIEGIEVHRRWKDRLRTRDDMAGLLADVRDSIDDPSSAGVVALLDRPDVIDRAHEANREAPGWASICEAVFCSWEDSTHWGNKMLRVELTTPIVELWPDARFVVLTRDPRGVMASQAKKFDHSVEYSAIYWNTHAEWISAHARNDPRYLIVDAVEMARDPKPALEWGFEQVGLSTDPITDLIERFPGDPDRLDNWRDVITADRQRRIEEYCFRGMGELGYTPELATSPRDIGTVRRVVALAREHGGEILRDPGSIRRKQIGRRIRSMLGR